MQLSREMAMRGNARAAVGPGGDGVPPASLPPSLEQRMLDSLAGPEYGGGAEQRSPPSGGSMPRSGAGPPSGAPSSRGRPTTAKLRQLKASLGQTDKEVVVLIEEWQDALDECERWERRAIRLRREADDRDALLRAEAAAEDALVKRALF